MLSGQEITIADSLVIAVIGLAIVMLELGLLALFITILSKVLAPFSRKKEAEIAAAESPGIVTDSGLADDEIAAVMVAVCQESGLAPEQINIKSIQLK